jgi:hypothetical protein
MKEFAEKMGEGVSKKTGEKLSFNTKRNQNLDSLTMVEYVSQTNGITDVIAVLDEEKFTYGLDLKFDSPLSLNSAMNRIQHYLAIEKDSTVELKSFEYYNFSEKSLTLKEPLKSKNDSNKEKETNKKLDKMTKMVSMQWEVSFTKRKIKKVDSNLKVKKKGKKQVILKIEGDQLEKRESENIATINLK